MAKSSSLPDSMQTFVQLGPNISIYTPATSNNTSATHSSPSLIILCSWMGAAPKHISKYIAGYQKVYPASRILLLRNELVDIFRPPAEHLARLRPALDIVLSTNSSRDSFPNGILLHAFSNGGANIATHLALLHRKHTLKPLPIQAMVLDSCPGTADSFGSGVRGFMSAFPASSTSAPVRLLAFIMAWVIMGFTFGMVVITGREGAITRLRRRLNEVTVIPQTSLRTYIYSESDELVNFRDVERHAAEAERSGWDGKVKMEMFIGTKHVAHVMGDPERYWSIVRTTYEEGLKQ